MLKYQYFNSTNLFGGNIFVNINMTPYALNSARSRLISKSEKTDDVLIVTKYEYDSQNRHNQPTAQEFTNSNSELNRTETKYTYDMPASTTKDALLLRNILTPYETIKKINGTQVDGSRTNFSLFSTHPRPSSIERYEYNAPTGAWNLKGTYNTYDASGNVTQFTIANWQPENYTWQNGLIKTKSFQNFTWTYNYVGNNTRILQSIVDIDGQTSSFTYDKLMRHLTTSARGGNVVSTNAYNYFTTAGTYNSVSTSTTFAASTNSSLTNKTDIQYLDGLGRAVETVKKAHSPTGKDVAIAMTYDDKGRLTKEHIAFEGTGATGAFITVPGTHPHKLVTYEASPLNRVSTVTPPSWFASTMTYGTNSTEVPGYAANTLIRETTTNPEGLQTSIYKDKKGRQIMTRNIKSTLDAKTEYQYDVKDRLTTVIPPGATNSNLYFSYTYDGQDRMITKKVPDAAIMTMVYNNRDLLAYTQDGNLAAQAKYIANEYDAYGRLTKSGFSTSNTTPNTPVFSEVLTENFYDGYNGVTQLPLNTVPQYRGKLRRNRTMVLGTTSDFVFSDFAYDSYGRNTNISGNNHLSIASTSTELINRTFDFGDNVTTDNRSHSNGTTTQAFNQRRVYDNQGRLYDYFVSIAGVENHTARYAYNARNEMIERNQHSNGSVWLQSIDYLYNDQGWLTDINQATLGGTNIPFPTCTTQVVNPGVTTTAQAIDLKDLFYMQLRYNTLHTNLSGTPRQDGNISQQVWRVRGRERQAYAYTYDGLQRLTAATYSDINDAGTVTASNRYNTTYTYADLRGNFANVSRTGLTLSGSCYTQSLIDNLTYNYTPNTNRIASITDAASATQGFAAASGTYTYDANGNITSNSAKGISAIAYNHLNLPTTFTISGGKTIDLVYDAAGRKLRKVVKTGTTINQVQEYVNGIEYRGTSIPATTVEAIYHAEGRLFNSSGWKREYTIKDHLGNARLSYSDLNDDGVIAVPAEIMQENHYEAFGQNLAGVYMNHNNADNLYQYNSKEYNNDHGIGLSDYGARWYDAGIGRFTGVDPLADKYMSISPFVYVANNPIKFIDPDGRTIIGTDGKPVTYERKDGEIVWSKNASNDTKELGNAMLSTEKGEQAFNSWQNAKTEVNIEINREEEGPDGATGETIPHSKKLNEDGQYKKIDVVIYTKSLEKSIAEGSGTRFEKASMEEAMGATGVHEEAHNNPAQIQLDRQVKNELSQDVNQNKPINAEIPFRQQYHEKHPNMPNAQTWRKNYDKKGYKGF